ncbi:SRPBCC family protein [Chelatococcus sp. SYSU_G07232]|uniref:SRPBCC family protein n=1 Tax=Chelatococcus albus TaxID=3047466 RepID=A0ABT7ACV6_9HYPH|nr:SRPBCC family protein [Chelatococcus sp. SYSU_G07232]MDJ1156832.1 SRPBCC family protein [Chelatococcus sp. SYSU_G07232]
MPVFRNARRVPYEPLEMFDLVADVERYPEFLPLCEALKVRRRAQSGEGVETLVADMSVGYKAIHESFLSRVTLDRPRLKVLVEYVDGPFRHLENRWSFKHDGDGCLVDFFISYEFKSFALGVLMGAVFDKAFAKFSDAFVARAEKVYGKRRTVPAGA